jgi:hypothetical protein
MPRTAPDLETLVALTHHKPDGWVGSENTWEVRDEVLSIPPPPQSLPNHSGLQAHNFHSLRCAHFAARHQVAELYEFKATSLLRELAAILVGPFILFFSTASRQSTRTHFTPHLPTPSPRRTRLTRTPPPQSTNSCHHRVLPEVHR